MSPSLDPEAEQEYGGRFLPEYQKRRLLGRGACGAVWLATSARHPKPVAVKQVAKGNTSKYKADEKAAQTEIAIGELFFDPGGVPKLSSSMYPGLRHVAKLLGVTETKRDLWLVQEFGGVALSKALFEIKGEFVARGAAQPKERVYRVCHLPFYEAMKRDPRVLKRLLRQVLEALHLLSVHEIVHSDLKPENVLLENVDGDEMRCEAKLCDFGSAFAFGQMEQTGMATPEYMPPEALETCVALSRCSSGAVAAAARARLCARPWSFDVWSLGAILLELCFGAPHWLSYRCRVRSVDGRDNSLQGLFAVPGRDPERILQRQMDIACDGGLRRALQGAPGVPLDEAGLDLLQSFLEWDPEHRISPESALEHPYLAVS